jgi:F0F1-type ATP synthase membrane subunit c/vacuolar-type H+-ATPase subunit K
MSQSEVGGNTDSMKSGFMHLASGLSVGLAGVAAGYTIGIVGDAVSSLCAPMRTPAHF